MRKYSLSAPRALLLMLATFMLTQCSAPDEEGAPLTSSSAGYNTELSLVDIMNLVLDPASDEVWAAGGWILSDAGYEELYPTTDEGWAYVRAQAAVVVESGNMLALPGRAVDNDAWMIYSQGLSSAGMLAMKAATAQNKEDFFQAGAQIYSVCTACHQAYSPDILDVFDEEAD